MLIGINITGVLEVKYVTSGDSISIVRKFIKRKRKY